jgi:hypothetical protein
MCEPTQQRIHQCARPDQSSQHLQLLTRNRDHSWMVKSDKCNC